MSMKEGPFARNGPVPLVVIECVHDIGRGIAKIEGPPVRAPGKCVRYADAGLPFCRPSIGSDAIQNSTGELDFQILPLRPDVERQTPRVSITVTRTARAKRRPRPAELKPFAAWNDGRPETELNFKYYRQATNKIAGLSDAAATFLGKFF